MAAKKAMPREYHGAMVDEVYPQDKQNEMGTIRGNQRAPSLIYSRPRPSSD